MGPYPKHSEWGRGGSGAEAGLGRADLEPGTRHLRSDSQIQRLLTTPIGAFLILGDVGDVAITDVLLRAQGGPPAVRPQVT